MNNLHGWIEDKQFITAVYRKYAPEYISTIKPVHEEYIQKIRQQITPDDVYPGIMTESMKSDPRLESFERYIADCAWDILNQQGYNMDYFYTLVQQLWGQYHPRTSSMEPHSHGDSSFLVGLYFIDVPEDSSKINFHDPRPAKIHTGLPLRQIDSLTYANDIISYTPRPGDLVITNSWLSHSFLRNRSQLPFNFLHFNIGVIRADSIEPPDTAIVV